MTTRKPTPPNLPRRFYKEAAVLRDGDKWAILLDDKPVRTPEKNHLATEHETLATLIAEEWAAQGDLIDPTTMPLTRLLNVSIDGAPGARDALADEVAKYAETDLVCHLADGPSELRARQDAGWGHWREWAGKKLDIVLVPVEGVIASPQPDASLKAARDHAASLDDLRLTALTWAMALYGSAVLALAVEQGELDALDAFDLSRIDETWQIEQWGEDEEAMEVVARRRADADAIGQLFAAIKA
ncbi:MAG: ATPase [Henriciella sp.]|nr:ATPase [Henriciella sp.]